jgi:hypothetical protein
MGPPMTTRRQSHLYRPTRTPGTGMSFTEAPRRAIPPVAFRGCQTPEKRVEHARRRKIKRDRRNGRDVNGKGKVRGTLSIYPASGMGSLLACQCRPPAIRLLGTQSETCARTVCERTVTVKLLHCHFCQDTIRQTLFLCICLQYTCVSIVSRVRANK